LSSNTFNCVGIASGLSMESYASFPFLPPARPQNLGGVYEFRTYHLKPGGLPATLAGWEAAIAPAHQYTAHLVTNMYALDGPPRITHIWGFSGVDERTKLRADHYAAGLWPPKGGPQQIAQASSTIAIAEPGLPLG
jgi:NIPSNAP